MAIYKTLIDVKGLNLDIEVNHNENTIYLAHEDGVIKLTTAEASELVNSLVESINLLTLKL